MQSESVLNESVVDKAVAFDVVIEPPTSPKPVLTDRRQSYRDSPDKIAAESQESLKKADERREKIIEAIRSSASDKVAHAHEVKEKAKMAETELMNKAKADSADKLKKADEKRAGHIETIKDQGERMVRRLGPVR